MQHICESVLRIAYTPYREYGFRFSIKGGELSYMALAMEREQTACISLLTVAGTVLADPKRCYLVWYAAASPWPSLLTYSLLHEANRTHC